jgi:hypothetical protein
MIVERFPLIICNDFQKWLTAPVKQSSNTLHKIDHVSSVGAVGFTIDIDSAAPGSIPADPMSIFYYLPFSLAPPSSCRGGEGGPHSAQRGHMQTSFFVV